MERNAEIESLREALRRRVEETSVRQVAAEVKMSHGGIYNLVAGDVVPYGKTLAKLRAWYVERTLRGGGGFTATAARYVIDQMLENVPRAVRPAAELEMLDNFKALYEKFHVPAPAWVIELRREAGGRTEGG
ncbi:hypothetical protein [Longimicrobium sp.]|uniref:hypothetical protein n=1 Tax=Longimicrobium sp. TaxID=2029185 RepID=UPI002C8A82DD|nr:hypothetical protein [Longimicrobium sp.]HSU15445.1 hypothetical protein [Longimicrobium sp.]